MNTPIRLGTRRRRRGTLPQRQRGIAMLVAILLVALGTIIAAAVAYESAMNARRGNATIDFDEALLVGQGAEALAAYGLQQMLRNGNGSPSGGGSGTGATPGPNGGSGSGAPGTQDIYPGQPWAQPIGPIEVVPGVTLEASLEDMQGRFNLNWLVDPTAQATGANGNPLPSGLPNPQQQPAGQPLPSGAPGTPQPGANTTPGARAVFNRLLELAHVSPEWTDKIVDWIDSNQMPEPQGAEDSAYLGQNPPYLTANQYLTSTTELLALPGFGRENYMKLAPYISALPPNTRLNICTAPGIVLDALKGNGSEWSDQEALDKNRATAGGCFPTVQVLTGTVDDPLAKQFVTAQTATTSRYFRLSSLITIGSAEFNLYSLLLVDDSGYYIHPVQRSFSPD